VAAAAALGMVARAERGGRARAVARAAAAAAKASGSAAPKAVRAVA